MHGRMSQAVLLKDVLAQPLGFVLVVLAQVISVHALSSFPFKRATQ
jgi:hypothetical protein